MRLNFEAPSTPLLYSLVFVAVFAWSLGPICVRYAFEYDMPPDVISALRMLIGAVVFTPIVLSRYKHELVSISPRHAILAMIAGMFFGLNLIGMITSLEHISVMINQVLIATNPIWVAILEVTVLKGRLNRMIWLGIFVAFIGGVVIATSTTGAPAIIEGGNAPLGVGLALFAALMAALYFVIGRSVRSSVSLVPYIWIVYTSGSVFTFIIIFFNQVPVTGYDPQGYFWVLALAILAQIIGHGTLNYVVKFLPPTLLSVMGQSVPILSGVWALLIFAEVPTVLQILGGIVILIGVTIVLNGQNRLKTKV